MRRSLVEVIEDGFQVTNKKGGYIEKDGEKNYLHQTYYRSSQYFKTAEKAVDSFIEEHNNS